jgi:hypothetical protein
MKIRIVKPMPPIKINNHWVYRIDDTIEIELNELIRYMKANYIDPHNIEYEKEVVNLIEDFLGYELEGK